jgi:hypothetical protein
LPERPCRFLIQCLNNEKIDFKGFGVKADQKQKTADFSYEGKKYQLHHGSVVIAAITSCTNTSNPNVMIGAGLLAKKAVELGLDVKPYIKTSLAPGFGTFATLRLRPSCLTFLFLQFRSCHGVLDPLWFTSIFGEAGLWRSRLRLHDLHW